MTALIESNMMKRTATSIENSLAPILVGVLASLHPVAPSPNRARAMKTDIMQKVAATKRAEHAKPVERSVETSVQPTVVRNPLHADVNWIRVTQQIDCQVLFDNDKTSAHVVRLAAGGVSLGHHHDRDEAAMVMEGWCMVGDIRLNTGDYHMVPAGASHDDIVSREGCVLFLHGSSYAPKQQHKAVPVRA